MVSGFLICIILYVPPLSPVNCYYTLKNVKYYDEIKEKIVTFIACLMRRARKK